MNIFYARVSTLDQKTDRQKLLLDDKVLFEDFVSGAIPFAQRPQGKKILDLLEKGKIESMTVSSIDRLGRDVKDLLEVIDCFSKRGISIFFINQGLTTLDNEGKESSVSKLVIGILGVVAEMERNQIKERQQQGISIAKAKGVYTGRKSGTKEDLVKFLSKPKNKVVAKELKAGYLNQTQIATLCNVHLNTVGKVKRAMQLAL